MPEGRRQMPEGRRQMPEIKEIPHFTVRDFSFN